MLITLEWSDAMLVHILHIYIKIDSSALEKGHRWFIVTANPTVKVLL